MREPTDYLKQINRFIDNALGTMQKVVSESNSLFYRIIEFPLKIITVLGVFAGFGFTGMFYVKNIWLFVAGEFCFAMAMIAGLYWHKKIIVNHKKIYETYIKRLNAYIKAWEKVGLNIAEKGCDDGEFKRNISRMQNKSTKIFKEEPQASDFILNAILWVFGIAAILLLVSFLPINWSKVFNYLLSAIYFYQN